MLKKNRKRGKRKYKKKYNRNSAYWMEKKKKVKIASMTTIFLSVKNSIKIFQTFLDWTHI